MATPACPSCGTQLPEQAVRFCTGCGYNLSQQKVLAPLPMPDQLGAARPAEPGSYAEPAAPPGYRDAPAPPAYHDTPAAPGYPAAPPYRATPAAPGYPDAAAPPGYRDAGLPDDRLAAPGGGEPLSDPWYRPDPGQLPPAARRRSRSWPIAAVIVVLVILGAGGWLLLGRGHSPAPGSPAGQAAAANPGSTSTAKASVQTTSPAGTPSGAEPAQLARLARLLRQSHAARSRVVRATQGVGGCTMTPAAGIDLMRQSVRQRQQVLAALASAQVSAIPGGQNVTADLRQVLRYSVSADHGFIGWMQQIQARGKCPVNVRRSAPYQAGLAASRQADRAKAAFLASWNPLASRFGQPTYNARRI
ncbi:MAG TPA: hypothetical protein VGI64_11095 [Streptosporangiaceae bacterium]|jgi:hypothetical protein